MSWNNLYDWKKIEEELLPDVNKSVLLGNGFSMSYAKNSFNHETIIKQIHEKIDWSKIQDTKNFNTIEEFICKIDDFQNNIYEDCVNILFADIPDNSSFNIEYKNFLSNFRTFYTLNYDPMLYRMLRHFRDNIKHSDGFYMENGLYSKKWGQPKTQSLFYLHGAFHIMENSIATIKLKATNGNMFNNMEKMQEFYQKPLIVLEGCSGKKMKKINNSPYLKHCFESFQNINGVLVTHGVAFLESDKHIIDAINKNNELEVYIGCHKDTDFANIKPQFERNERVKYFETESMFKNNEE